MLRKVPQEASQILLADRTDGIKVTGRAIVLGKIAAQAKECIPTDAAIPNIDSLR